MSSYIASTFNAFEFAGAGWIFSKINHSGYVAEMRRHNEAMEKLAKDHEKWSRERSEELDRVSNLRYEQKEGYEDIKSTNVDLRHVETKFGEAVLEKERYFASTEPKLGSYYRPGKEMSEYIVFVKVLMIGGVVFVIYKIM